MEFYLLGMVLVPLALAAVGSIIESRLKEDEEQEDIPLMEQKAA